MSMLLWPPIAFFIILAVCAFKLRAVKVLSGTDQSPRPEGQGKAYACGEDMPTNRCNPDYSQFFPFAFFFTIIHVLALVVATVPRGDWASIPIAAGYLIASAIGVFVLFRR